MLLWILSASRPLCLIRAWYECAVERRVRSRQRDVKWGRGSGRTSDRLPHMQPVLWRKRKNQSDAAILFLWRWTMSFSLRISPVWTCCPFMVLLLPHCCREIKPGTKRFSGFGKCAKMTALAFLAFGRWKRWRRVSFLTWAKKKTCRGTLENLF